MNKHRYRLIFNRTRGLIMAVAENTLARNTAPGTASDHHHPLEETALAVLSPLHLAPMLMLGSALVIINSSHADIIADSSAPASQQPIIGSTANGLPLVNIQTPSAAGVSRNTYSHFDVNAQGAILNNSNTYVQTQLGGWVQGNPFLAGGTARVILNEVNSSNPSLLHGFVEIAGSRAQLVIANPAGISCNGCGFINANRATLTTSTPIINGGNLLAYRVGGGSISFLGNGMDASRTDYTDIITRAVEVNAGIWANTLNITTGIQQVNVDSSGKQASTTPITADSGSATPAFAVDVAALGGMYAGKIHLIGTEAGLGVRNAGTIGASVGEVVITADGQIINRGSISAQTALQVQTSTVLDNTQGTLAARGTINLHTSSLNNTSGTIAAHQAASISTGALTNTSGTLQTEGDLDINSASLTGDGDILVQGHLRIATQGNIHNSGRMIANGSLQLSTDGQLINTSQLQAGQTLQLAAQNLDNQAAGEISAANSSLLLTGPLTNRGLIDGGNNVIQADTIDNIGSGRIYGDHLAIQAASLSNQAETLDGSTTAATIAARDRLDLGIATLVNQQRAAIFSAGDLAIGATLDTNHHATGRAGSILNESASIEALGDIHITANSLTNQRTEFSMQRVQVGNSSSYRQECASDNCSYVWHITTQATEYEDQISTSSPSASILAAGDGQLAIDQLVNQYSSIEIGGDFTLTGTTLDNQGAERYHQTDTIISKNLIHWGDRDHGTWATSDSTSTLIDTIPAIISAGGNLTGTFTERIDNLTIREQTAPLTNPNGSAPDTSVPVNLHNPISSSLFHPAPDAAASYLIETNPKFASYRNWLSSDYMMQQLSFDPAITQKRLGDGFYEQRLVREQIAELTGRRFLASHVNDETQYQALMSAGLTQAGSLQLIPGIALTAEQATQLTSDIVWLVEQEVALPDGTVTRTLVPQVYVRLQEGDIAPSGAVLAGSNVNLQVNGDLNTSGTVAGRNVVNITADNINHVRGLIAGTDVALIASHDIHIEGGSVAGKGSLIAHAGNNLTVQSSTAELDVHLAGGPTHVQSRVIDRVAGLYVSNPDAILIASAGNDLNLMAAAVQNEGSNGQTLLQAGNNLNIGTVETTTDSYATGRKSWRKEQSSSDIGSNIATSGNITIQAGNNLGVTASSINSDAGDLAAIAGGDIALTAGTNTFTSEAYRKINTTSRKKEYRDSIDQTTHTGSTLSAENIVLQAGAAGTGNLSVAGSNIVSTSSTRLQAADDVTITAVENTLNEIHTKKEKKSGFSASGSSIGYGSSKLSQKQTGASVTQVGSTVGSVEGDVVIQAGNIYTQTGSDVLAPKGDIEITAQQVNIIASNNTATQTTETKFKQTGLTLSITSPVISAIQTAERIKRAASNTSDGRMQALAAGATALAAKNAFDSTQQALSAIPADNSITNAANQAGGLNLSLSIGTSKSSSSSTQISNTAQGSAVVAGGDITIHASGAGKDSDINIVGSQVTAGGNVNIKAEDEVSLLAAQNTVTLNSRNKSSSASVGVSIGSNGLAITASASQGKGKANGTDVTWTESIVQVGSKIALESGTDTNIIGAQVRGDQVIANIGTSGDGNLNIQSLQDTSTYDSKQKNTGISVSVPIGAGMAGGSFSASNSKIKNNYASVNEQAGIFAGDGGFQVNVNGNTNLTGAVIASSEQAIVENRNSLTTETLTVSNIANQAEYDAKATSATVGGGLQAGLPVLSGAGVGSDSGKASSTTVSAISGGAINITDDAGQQAKSGTDAATTIALLNRDVHVDEQGDAVDSNGNSTANIIASIFDQEQVQKEIEAQVKITQTFNQEAPRALATYAASKTQPYQDAKDYELIKNRAENNILLTEYELNRLIALEASGMTLEAAQTILNDPQAKSDYENWSDNGNYRRATNIIIAAIGGSSSELVSAVTKGSLSWAADQMRQLMIEDSKKFTGLCDSQGNCISNTSGNSAGVDGDGFKLAGGRIVLADWCAGGRCTPDSMTKSGWAENPDGTVKFNPTDVNGNLITLTEFVAQNQSWRSELGGHQGSQGQIALLGIQFNYEKGSFWDELAEAYAGTHDTLNSIIWYDSSGNGKNLDNNLIGNIGDITNMTNVGVATPFALSILLPPEVWNSISTLMKLK